MYQKQYDVSSELALYGGSPDEILEAEKSDPTEIKVTASAHCVEDVEEAVTEQADAIGLVRIERVMAAADCILDVQELELELGAIACSSEGREITFRLADFAPNKVSEAMEAKLPRDVSFGHRLGVEYLLYNYRMLRDQIVALVRLAQSHSIRILVPRVEDAYQMLLLKMRIKEEAKRLNVGRIPPLGAMFESALAIQKAFSISKQSDFLCVGSNDLAISVTKSGEQGIWETSGVDFDDARLFFALERLRQTVAERSFELYGGLAYRVEHLPKLIRMGFLSYCVKPEGVSLLRKALSEVG